MSVYIGSSWKISVAGSLINEFAKKHSDVKISITNDLVVILEDAGTSDYSEADIQKLLDDKITHYPLEKLRELRNQLLVETDYVGMSDYVAKDQEKFEKVKSYRQELRDITETNTNCFVNDKFELDGYVLPEKV